MPGGLNRAKQLFHTPAQLLRNNYQTFVKQMKALVLVSIKSFCLKDTFQKHVYDQDQKV